MGVFVPVTNGAQFTLQYAQQDGSFAENEFWVQRTGAWTTVLLTAMAAGFKQWWETGDGANSLKQTQCAAMSLQGVGYRDHTTQNGLTGIYQTGLPESATGAGTASPLGLAFSVTARTGLAGRSFRGRTFINGLVTSNFSDATKNLVSAGTAGYYLNAFNALITKVAAVDAACTLVVCSRFHQPGGSGTPSVPRASGVTTPITSYGYHDLFADFQRRRSPGHNRHR